MRCQYYINDLCLADTLSPHADRKSCLPGKQRPPGVPEGFPETLMRMKYLATGWIAS